MKNIFNPKFEIKIIEQDVTAVIYQIIDSLNNKRVDKVYEIKEGIRFQNNFIKGRRTWDKSDWIMNGLIEIVDKEQKLIRFSTNLNTMMILGTTVSLIIGILSGEIILGFVFWGLFWINLLIMKKIYKDFILDILKENHIEVKLLNVD